jgi:putative endopeptidase
MKVASYGADAMLNLTCRIVAVILVIFGAQNIAPMGLASDYTAATTGGWGFDFTGADFTKKPGDDFFRYANGGWYDRAVIPADRSSIGPSIGLSMAAEARIREILEQERQGGGPSAQADASKIGAFYAAFMNEARAEALDVQPIAALIAMIRSASTRAELVDLMGASCRSFFDSVFSLRVSHDDAAPGRYVVSIGQGGLGLNRDYYVAPRLAEKKRAYLTYMTQLLGMIDWQAPAETAAAILAFETAIARVSWTETERSDPNKTYNPMTVSALEKSAPFPWRRLLANANLGGLEHLVVVEKTALPKIAAIYARTPLRTLKAWQAFHLADAAAPYLSKRFVAANFAFHGKVMTGVAQQPERWSRAVDTIEDAMGQAVGRAYAARYFSPETKAQIADLTAELGIALKARIERLDWMSQRTKRKALDKLARLNVKIGYPDKWRDYSGLEVRPDDLVGNIQAALKFDWLMDVKRLHSRVDRSEWDTSPQTVNAFYDDNLNEMILPAGMFQLPFFDPGADPAANYGGMGAVIGHEMSHAFDNEGRKYDGNGRLSTWWTRADARQFKARAAKLVRQFDGYEPLSGVYVKGNLTLGENIADLAGASVALDAYHHSLGDRPAPVIDGLTGDQRFFLSYAQSWREKSTSASIRQQIVSDPHAPEQYRVNGVLRNMDAWYKAFNVKPSDKLYLSPKNRVRIW